MIDFASPIEQYFAWNQLEISIINFLSDLKSNIEREKRKEQNSTGFFPQ